MDKLETAQMSLMEGALCNLRRAQKLAKLGGADCTKLDFLINYLERQLPYVGTDPFPCPVTITGSAG